jgi:hypothetical protein
MVKTLARPLASPVARSLVIQQGGGGTPVISEYITNGGFDTDTDWTKGAGWTITGGAAECDGGVGMLSQDFSALTAALTNGNDYLLTYTLVNGNAGTVRARLTGGAGGQNFDTSDAGLISVPFTANDGRTTINFQSIDSEAISIDDVSITPA